MGIIGTIFGSKLVNDVVGIVDKFVPDKTKKQEFEFELKKMLEQNNSEYEKMLLEDVNSARNLAAKQAEQSHGKFIEIYRSLPRPTIALISTFLWGYIILSRVITGMPHLVLNHFDYGLIGAVFTFYFGSRTFEKLKIGAANGNKQK